MLTTPPGSRVIAILAVFFSPSPWHENRRKAYISLETPRIFRCPSCLLEISIQDLIEASDETPSFGVRLNLRVESGYEFLRQTVQEERNSWRTATGETILMQKLVLAPMAMLLAAVASAHGEEPQAGRYQMVAVPASQSQTFPQTLLLDTATGQTWILYHETGQAIQWLPLRFSAGTDRPQNSLAAVAGRRWRIALRDGSIPIARPPLQ